MQVKKMLFNLKINETVKYLTFSDTIIWSGWGLISPILSVFFSDQIVDGSVAVAGIATTLYFLSNSLLQIPVASYIDRKKGEKDDFYVLLLGTLMFSLSAFAFILATHSWHVYLIQIMSGMGAALAAPAWYAIFTRHLDKNREGVEWSIYNTLIALGSSLTAAIGGLMAEKWGYKVVFLTVGFVSIFGTIYILKIAKDLKIKLAALK